VPPSLAAQYTNLNPGVPYILQDSASNGCLTNGTTQYVTCYSGLSGATPAEMFTFWNAALISDVTNPLVPGSSSVFLKSEPIGT
jgi:hypothetical protein